MDKQQANPGGNLAPHEVVGRDALVAQLWRILERRSLYITAERRMGKTAVIRDKMGKAPPDDWKLIYLDVSKAVTPLQFVEGLLEKSRPHLDTGKKAKFAFHGLVSQLAGVDIKAGIGIKLPEELGMHWKQLLQTLLSDLSQLTPRIVLAFDELPLMLDAIKRGKEGVTGEALIMELLDTLRAIRQEADLRMIYTGSLGLHHVLTVLREQGYQNDPLNDMHLVDLEPLTQADATELARRLLLGEGVVCSSLDNLADYLARMTQGIPYYLQHIVSEMGMYAKPGTVDEVDRCLKARLADPLDPWQLDYYDDRIETHYPAAYRPIARKVLDQLAEGKPQTLEELTEGIDPAQIERDTETVRKVLRLLGLDHYTTFDGQRYRFRNAFILRVWRNRRGKGV